MHSIEPQPPSLEDFLNITREIREDMARHEERLGKVIESLDIICEIREDMARNEERFGRVIERLDILYAEFSSEQFLSVWLPTKGKEGLVEPIQPFPEIRKVEGMHPKVHDIGGRLRKTWLGQLYINHLKKYVIVRWIAHWIWRNGYPFYVNYIASRLSNRKEKRWRSLIKLRDHVNNNKIPIYKMTDSAVVETPKPKVFPTCDQSYLKPPHDRFRFSEIYVATINNAITYGGTNFILADGEVVCHDLYDFERDYTSEELHGRALIDPKSGRIRWLLHDNAPEPIPVAATFVDACASNYAHWVTEVLPRIVLFCAEDRFRSIPIVVNDGLHKNIMESLFLVAGTEREIITLSIGRALAVNKLYLTSVAGYVPFERRKNKLSGHSHGVFSPLAFGALRNHLNALGWKNEQEAWPEKIFLRRNSGVRKVANSTELEALLVAQGYVIVEPEKLSFLEQVGLFSNVKVVVASSGAAIANIIFCKPASKILILISKQPHTSYWYWQNMATASGNSVKYILGETVAGSGGSIHDDFYISSEEVLKALN
jgi:capsular polysaccharide biosynthesis protein